MGGPLITILTPTRHRPLAVLERCVTSVNRQTLLDWLHLICSDGQQEPAVEEFVRQEHDERRRCLYLTPPRGHYGAGVRAALLDRVQTPYVAFLDDDNVLFPRFCEDMTQTLSEHPEAGWAICQILHCGPLHPRFGLPPAVLTGIPPVPANIDTLQVVARTDVIRQSGWVLNGYLSDGATYEKLAKSSPWIAVDEVLGAHV
ncbi:MAG TPA: glycosyltransferase family A protein [Gemmataceae bacterium]|nr:glycosyltransferase family A protein [Gemmataceae bacterium]